MLLQNHILRQQEQINMKGIIIINAYLQMKEALYQPKRLQEEFKKLGVDVDIKQNNFFPCSLEDNNIVSKLSDYAFCIYLDKDKYVLKALSKLKMPIFNSYEAIATCDDKMMTYLALANTGIKMPKTLPGLLCYSVNENIAIETINLIEHELKYPLIVKKSFGSLGSGVYLANDHTQLLDAMEQVKCSPHLIQEFISTSFGRDLRIIVIGSEVVGGMLRTSQNDFRSNIGAGGSGKAYDVPKKLAELSLKITKLLNLDFCGIDFLFGNNDEFVLCEVNSNAFFYNFEQCTKINVAKIYCQYILKNISNN